MTSRACPNVKGIMPVILLTNRHVITFLDNRTNFLIGYSFLDNIGENGNRVRSLREKKNRKEERRRREEDARETAKVVMVAATGCRLFKD